MDPRRLFASHPPRSDLHTLRQLVEDWQWRFGEGGPGELSRDTVVEYCRDAPALSAAVMRACMSLRPNGKMHNHQSRVAKAVLLQFYSLIWAHHSEWLRSVKASQTGLSEGPVHTIFDRLYDRLDRIKPAGIGPVTLYDVATRIVAYLGYAEQQLYFHAGVKAGWRDLYPRDLDLDMWRLSEELRIPRYMFPPSLVLLPTSEVEDFLCAYRSLFGGLAERE